MKNERYSFLVLTTTLSLALVGCAAQDAHRTYSRVETKLSKAIAQADPNEAAFRDANQALILGRAQLLAGRYDLAIRSFREADRLTDLGQSELAARKADALALAEQKAAEKAKADEAAALAAAAKVNESLALGATDPALPDSQSAVSSGGKALDSLVVENTPANEAGELRAAPAPAPVDPKIPATIEKPNVVKPATVKPKASVSAATVIASAKPEQKKAPVADSKATTSVGDKKRRSIGNITFVSKDASIIEESMTQLNQTAKFLLDNPSRSLFLLGSYSPDEPKGIVDQRLESVKAYLVGKGVPEDQILFDEEKKRGSAEVALFESEE